ncbi:MAG: alpha/beta fold hydrolase [Micropepsaceae bacterium]
MTTFVLVHGAWHGAWCWELVSEALEGMGHKVIAPDLPGMGADKTPLKDVSLASWADHVCGLIRPLGEKVVLAGHSRGGVVISEIAERIPESISRLAYVAAFLVPNGKTLSDMLTLSEPREVSKNAIDMREDGISSMIAAPRVGPIFYNTSKPALQARAASMLTPEPMMSFLTPVSVSEQRFGSVPRAYIECLQDNAIPVELQRAMQSALPCKPVITLDCDHSPFYSQPGKLAEALVKIAQ